MMVILPFQPFPVRVEGLDALFERYSVTGSRLWLLLTARWLEKFSTEGSVFSVYYHYLLFGDLNSCL